MYEMLFEHNGIWQTVFGSGKMQTTRFCGERTGTCKNFLTRDTKMVKRVWMRTV